MFKTLKQDLSQPKIQDPAFYSWIEIFFNYPGVWALVNYRFANFFYLKGFKRIARIISGISRFLTSTDIHPAATIGNNVFFDHATGIVIGETTIIGDNVLIYQGVTLGGVSLNKGKRHPTIQDGVVIGAGAKILGDITIGANSKIGANSVVVKDVPQNSTAVGIPAKIIDKCDKDRLSHNKIPDIDSEIFEYIIKKISYLQELNSDKISDEKYKNLEEKFQTCLKTIKNKEL